MSINYGVQPAKFEGNDTDLFAFSRVAFLMLISLRYLYHISWIVTILTGHFLENEGRGGGMINSKIVHIMLFHIITIVKCFIECLQYLKLLQIITLIIKSLYLIHVSVI